MKYDVAIEEQLCRVIEVEAESELEAYTLACKMYANEEVVLEYSDYVDSDIHVLGETE